MIDNETACQCPHCTSGEFYDPADYQLDVASLDNERTKGVSGILNTRTDSSTIAACIDSCIHALDELVITYNCPFDKHLDNTLDILKAKKAQYPEKISLMEYHVPFDCTIDQGERIGDHLYKTGIHTQANMHNLGMQRAKFSHYCRIDGDQIYFPAYLKKICDSIKNNSELIDVLGNLVNHNNEQILTTYNMSMINIFPHEDLWYVSTDHQKFRDCFSGCGDHVIHKISSQTMYATKTDLNHKFIGPDLFVPYERQKQKGADRLTSSSYIGYMSFHCKHVSAFQRYSDFAEGFNYIDHYRENVFLPNFDDFVEINTALENEFDQFRNISPNWIIGAWEKSWEQRVGMVDVKPLAQMNEPGFLKACSRIIRRSKTRRYFRYISTPLAVFAR